MTHRNNFVFINYFSISIKSFQLIFDCIKLNTIKLKPSVICKVWPLKKLKVNHNTFKTTKYRNQYVARFLMLKRNNCLDGIIRSLMR